MPDSTSGIPYAAFGKDNEAVLKVVEDELVRALIARLEKLSSDPCDHGPVDLVRRGLVDVVRLFVKQEPHKRAKIETGRFRLIMNISLLDQMVERVLYQSFSKDEISRWDSIPSKPGMGSADEGIEILARNLENLSARGALLDTDISAWDWQRKWWVSFVTVTTHLLQAGLFGQYAEMCYAREVCASAQVFATSAGELFVTRTFGIMSSGRFVTSFFNSKGRTAMCTMVGTDNIAMGDDCQEGVADSSDATAVIQAYEAFGWKGLIESAVSQSLEGAIFCSLRFYRRDGLWRAEPVNWRRTLFRLLCKKQLPFAELCQFEWEVRHLRVDGLQGLVVDWAKRFM